MLAQAASVDCRLRGNDEETGPRLSDVARIDSMRLHASLIAAGLAALLFELVLLAVEFAAGAPQADSPKAIAARNIAKLERFMNGHLKV